MHGGAGSAKGNAGGLKRKKPSLKQADAGGVVTAEDRIFLTTEYTEYTEGEQDGMLRFKPSGFRVFRVFRGCDQAAGHGHLDKTCRHAMLATQFNQPQTTFP